MESLRRNKKTIIYASTGSGKSVIGAFMAEGSAIKNNKTLILTHRTEILKQNFKKMDMLGLKVAMISPHSKVVADSQIYCAMSQTLAARCKSERDGEQYRKLMASFDFVIADEVDRGEHEALYQYFKKDAWIVGMSATILRSGAMKQLGDTYSDIVKVVTTRELVDLKYLTPSKNYTFLAPKLDDIDFDRSKGDFNQQQLQKRFMSPERYAGVIENYKRLCMGSKAICFTCGIDHCIELCQAFILAGIRAKYLVSERRPDTDKVMSGNRAKLLESFDRGDFEVLVNVGMTSVGFDCPSVETVILDFATKSYARYIQSIGRASRLYQGKTHFNVLDFGSNIERFGLFEDDATCSLWHSVSRGGVAPVKECPANRIDRNGKSGCLRLVPISATDCPFCGYHWDSEKETYSVELQEVIKEQAEDMETIEGFCAAKKLAGWENDWILRDLCIKNKDNQKEVFMRAIKILKTDSGQYVSPSYWHFFKKTKLDAKKTKKGST